MSGGCAACDSLPSLERGRPGSWTKRPSRSGSRAAELGAHIIVTILPHQLDELAEVLRRFPASAVSLDHCAFALSDRRTRARLFELAAHPNLHLKVSTHNLDDAVRTDGHARGLVRRTRRGVQRRPSHVGLRLLSDP